jgi:prepilin-type N-terminal cleavage/methylation domain-containing protein|tara:strand:+ start:567 stop:953 length:387 start_codon:yes stop_codon:yes gene_type:complete
MRRYSQGFTLIELLVVVALIGILSAIGIVSYGKYKTSAEKKQAEISLSSIYLAEQEYKSNNGSYYYNSSLNNIINELFDGVDDLSDQNYNYTITGNASSDTLSIQAKHKTSNCTLTLNEKNKLTTSNC